MEVTEPVPMIKQTLTPNEVAPEFTKFNASLTTVKTYAFNVTHPMN